MHGKREDDIPLLTYIPTSTIPFLTTASHLLSIITGQTEVLHLSRILLNSKSIPQRTADQALMRYHLPVSSSNQPISDCYTLCEGFGSAS